jgi:tight adherence protein C
MIGLGLVLLVGLLLFILARSRQSDTLEDRLEEFGALERAPTLEEMEMARPFSERVLIPVLEGLAQFATRFTPQKTLEATQHQLDLGGNPNNFGPAQFLGLRILLALLLGGLGLVLLVTATSMPFARRIMMVGVGAALGYYLPGMWLGGKIKTRQEEIVKALPDTLDLLTICVEAGLGFDAAMARVADKWDNEMCRGFAQVIQEIQLGKLRRDALRHMADTMEVRDVTTFVAAIIQAGQLGVSIAKVLRIQSDQMRMRRRQRAEELANQAPLKMMPALLLIFPALFIVLLGPAVIMVKDMFMGGGGPIP